MGDAIAAPEKTAGYSLSFLYLGPWLDVVVSHLGGFQHFWNKFSVFLQTAAQFVQKVYF